MDIPTFSSILSCNHSLFQYTQFPHLWQEQKHSIGCNRPQNIAGGCNRLSLSLQFILSHLISSYRKKFQYIRQANHPAAPFITAAIQLHFCTSSAKHRHKKIENVSRETFSIFLTYLYPFFSALPQIIFHYFI